ncbi:hypothetical protein DXG01_016115 [Tephrocybe rancida]|nr:hypothetical protein DXG01_016115 [Tephrocybe rancida]
MPSHLSAHRGLYTTHPGIHILIILVSVPAALGVNFNQCLTDIQGGKFGQSGGTDNHGREVAISNATAITYELCTRACGSAPEPFQWSVFSQEFSSWLLPWLALVSQLPFGSEDKLDNLTSMLLTVGSPTLAAYSLVLTVLNGRWIARRFSSYTFPNTHLAVRILSSLQQSPLHINTDYSLLSSLIVLPLNDDWWRDLKEGLEYTHTWSISAVTSIAWVIIAYLFTVIDSFIGDITVSINANGQGVGSLWIWLLPIVVGWLQISPKCDTTRLFKAVNGANKLAYVAMPDGRPIIANSLSSQRAITLRQGVEDPLYHDETCTIPIYNYARFLPWVQAVETVSDMFRSASQQAHFHRPVDRGMKWEVGEGYATGARVNPRNRIGTCEQVDNYCLPIGEPSKGHKTVWGPDVFSRVLIASSIALSLQWGTAGAAIVVVWFTPTTGHRKTLARWMAITVRRTGKILAAFNAVWVVVSCLFQFSNFFDRCYCNGSVLGQGVTSWIVITFIPDDLSSMKGAWIGGVALAAGSATLFVVFVNLFINPQLPG